MACLRFRENKGDAASLLQTPGTGSQFMSDCNQKKLLLE